MGRRSKSSTAVLEAPPAQSANGAPEPMLPEVSNLPPVIQKLTYSQRLALAHEFLTQPRKALLKATNGDLFDAGALPEVKFDEVAYSELKSVISAFLPDWKTSAVSDRRLHKAFLLQKLGDQPAMELEERLHGLVKRLLPYLHEDRETKLKQHRELVADVVQEIDAEIANRITEGERHSDIIATKDLPQNAIRCVHTDSDLYWRLVRPFNLAIVLWDAIPEDSPLKKSFEAERVPGLSKAGGTRVILLGPARPGTLMPIPRPWYLLATVAAFTVRGYQEWAQRHRTFLDMNRETSADFERFQRFEQLLKKPYAPPWVYPDPPPPPALKGFENRVLFAIDLVGHLQRYITKPMTKLSLAELLQARRVLVEPAADQSPDVCGQAAKSWVSKWCGHNNRSDLYDCLGSIASTTLKAIEELEEKAQDHILAEYQRKFVFKSEKKDAD